MPDDSMSIAPAPKNRAPLQQGGGMHAIVPQDIEQAWRMAGMIKRGGWAPDSMKTEEAITIAIFKGLEVGLKPMQAVQSIAVINGRPTIWGDAGIGLVAASGLLKGKREWIEGAGDDMTAYCELKRDGWESPIVAQFSVQDAKTAKLWGKSGPWQTYPRRMLQNRARWWALRDGFADVLGGLSITEEMQEIGPDHAKDITPPARPSRSDYVDAEPEPMFSYEALDGSSITSGDPEEFAETAVGLLLECNSTLSVDELRDRISVNFDALRNAERADLVDYIEGEFGKVWDGLRAASAAKAAAEAEEKFPGDDEDDEAPGEPSALELACSVDEKVKAATPDTIEGLSNEVEIAAKALTNDGLADQAKNLKSRYEARRMNLTGEPDGRLV